MSKLWAKYEKMKRGLGAVRVMRAVNSSTATASFTQFFMSVEKSSIGAWLLSILMVNTRSCAVHGWPSLHFTPGRIFTTTSVKSALYWWLRAIHGIRVSCAPYAL